MLPNKTTEAADRSTKQSITNQCSATFRAVIKAHAPAPGRPRTALVTPTHGGRIFSASLVKGFTYTLIGRCAWPADHPASYRPTTKARLVSVAAGGDALNGAHVDTRTDPTRLGTARRSSTRAGAHPRPESAGASSDDGTFPLGEVGVEWCSAVVGRSVGWRRGFSALRRA